MDAPLTKRMKSGSESTIDTVFESNNYLTRNESEKLYLDAETADVKFVFGAGTDHMETVPAHKCFLSVCSPMFHTMFYGSLPEQGDVPIVDATAAAFKEFLQFFYLSTVRLTHGNIIGVSTLCKKYGLIEPLKICEKPLQDSFSIDELCSGFALANLLEIRDTIEFCTKKIELNASAILVSTSFLECDRKTVDKIIQLVTSKCSASAISDACMAWVKAECGRKNLDETSENLKAQLGQVFNRIPFAKLKNKQFIQFIATYNGLLHASDLAEITQKVMMKMDSLNRQVETLSKHNGTLKYRNETSMDLIRELRSQTKNLTSQIANLTEQAELVTRTLECDRRIQGSSCMSHCRSDHNNNSKSDSSYFKSTKGLMLTEINFSGIATKNGFGIRVSICVDALFARVVVRPSFRLESTGDNEYRAVFEHPILIQPNHRYEVEMENSRNIHPNTRFLSEVKLRDGTLIKFDDCLGPVSRLVFRKTKI